jgi:hypothetical protein
MTKTDTPIFVVFNPQGLVVRGEHQQVTPAVPEAEAELFQEFHQAWREYVLSSDAGFDGPRAVLVDYSHVDGVICLQTAYRTYTEGLALRDTLRKHGLSANAGAPRPQAELAWGLSLSAFVLLPGDSVLCAQRAQTLAVLPGRWVARHTEVVEPADIDPSSMQGLLERLVAEELPELRGMGLAKFVGLAVRPQLHDWQLIAVLDLRHVELGRLNQALERLAPDTETAAWAICSVSRLSESNTHEALQLLPSHLRYTGAFEPDDLALARDLYDKVPQQ